MNGLMGMVPILLLALVALAAAWWRGCLDPRALAAAPEREVRISGRDMLLAVSVFLAGFVVSGMVLPFSDVPHERWDAWQRAVGGVVIQLGSAVPVLLLLGVILWRQPRGFVRLGFGWPTAGQLMTGVGGWLLALPVVLACNALLVWMTAVAGGEAPRQGHEIFKMLTGEVSTGTVVLIWLSAVVIAPVMEEIFYRGMLQSCLVRFFQEQGGGLSGRWAGVVVASLGFSAVHYGNVPWQVFPSLFMLGVVLGWVYERTGSLWPAVLLHFLFNLSNLLMALAVQKMGWEGAVP